MKKFTRLAAMLLSMILTAAIFSGCSNSAKDNAETRIGIAMLVENGAFLSMKDGIISQLALSGYTEENTEFVYKCAAGDATSLSTICSSMDDGSYDLVFAIATPAAQQFVSLESSTPCFFCAVSAPVAAGIISDMATPDKNATGTSNAIPVDNIFALADVLTPGINKWGLLYCASETNAANTVSACEAYLSAANIAYVTKTVNNTSEIATVTEALISDGCTAVFVPNDSVIQSGVSSLAEICREAKIPTYCSSATTVLSGCFATIAIDDEGIGAKTAEMAVQYLNGTPVSEIPADVVAADYISINDSAMNALGIELENSDSLTVGNIKYSVIHFS